MPRTRRTIYSTAGRSGGRRISTNAQFAQDVNTRLYGGKGANGTLARVAASRSSNTPVGIVDEVNRRGGRNALRTSPHGTLSAHKARYRELRATFGLSVG